MSASELHTAGSSVQDGSRSSCSCNLNPLTVFSTTGCAPVCGLRDATLANTAALIGKTAHVLPGIVVRAAVIRPNACRSVGAALVDGRAVAVVAQGALRQGCRDSRHQQRGEETDSCEIHRCSLQNRETAIEFSHRSRQHQACRSSESSSAAHARAGPCDVARKRPVSRNAEFASVNQVTGCICS